MKIGVCLLPGLLFLSITSEAFSGELPASAPNLKKDESSSLPPQADQKEEPYVKPKRPNSLEDLVKNANFIFQGKVKSVDFGHSNNESGRFPITYITYDISEVIYGEYSSKTITLQQIGGLDGDSVLTSKSVPLFEQGDSDILFIRGNGKAFTPVINGGRFRIFGNDVFNAIGHAYQEDISGNISISLDRIDIPYFSKRSLGPSIIQIRPSIADEKKPIKEQGKINLSLESLKSRIRHQIKTRPQGSEIEVSIEGRTEGLAKVVLVPSNIK